MLKMYLVNTLRYLQKIFYNFDNKNNKKDTDPFLPKGTAEENFDYALDLASQLDFQNAEKAFKDALAGKISAALDTKRTDVAKSWLNEPQEVPTDETPQEVEVTSDVPSDEKPEIAEPGVDPKLSLEDTLIVPKVIVVDPEYVLVPDRVKILELEVFVSAPVPLITPDNV